MTRRLVDVHFTVSERLTHATLPFGMMARATAMLLRM